MFINTLTDEELLRAFACNCKHIAKARRNKDLENLAHYVSDADFIMREVGNRLPEEFQQELTNMTSHIQPGNWYKHKTFGALRLQVIDDIEYQGPLWNCRVYIGNKWTRMVYINRFIIKQTTLTQHYQKI